MSKTLQFEENLKSALEEYGLVDSEIAKLEDRKKLLRSQIQKWMDVNNLDTFEVRDNNEQIWKIKKDIQSRKSIGDWDILKDVLDKSGNANLIVEKCFDTFGIKKLKRFSDEWLSK